MANPKPPQRFTAGSIGQLIDCIDLISNHFIPTNTANAPILWYRAQREQAWSLTPSLFRGASLKGDDYNELNLKEDYRIHGFVARARHVIADKPGNKLDWLEIMQHHIMGTRLMDWSESLDIALIFALEAFLDFDKSNKELAIRRKDMAPCIWVINPYLLNSKVYDSFANGLTGLNMVKEAFKNEPANSLRIWQKLRTGKAKFFGKSAGGPEFDPYLSGFINLSAIEDLRQANQSRMQKLLANEQFNPFFYLLVRYYIDGVKAAVEDLPPLAIVNPYHSLRMRQQKGTFTVFPYYIWRDDKEGFYQDLGINSLAMDKQPKIQDCVYQIRLTDPELIADQLLRLGKRRADIYPELENYARDLQR